MSYFVRPRPLVKPALRLIAFHHAGGSAAMYHPMSAEMPADWELHLHALPGRGQRFTEPPIDDMTTLIARVVQEVRPWLDPPVALFGHSLGAILAVEIGRVCEQRGAPPVWVGASGRVAPTIQAHARRLSLLDDETLLAEVIALGGTPDRLGEIPELRAHFLRVVRADFAALESYQPAPQRAPLSCPLTAFAGINDTLAPPATMRPWARETSNAFHLRLFAGGHLYFLGPAFAGFTAEIVREIASHLTRSTS
jgi:surfactin synthase thioesterase subunit